MENKSHAFWTGLFTIVLVLAIASAVFFFNVDRTVRVPYDLIARTNVTGLVHGCRRALSWAGRRQGGIDQIRQGSSGADPHPRRSERADDALHLRDARPRLSRCDGHRLRATGRHRQGRDRPRFVAATRGRSADRAGLFEQLQERGDVILKKFERLSDDADSSSPTTCATS